MNRANKIARNKRKRKHKHFAPILTIKSSAESIPRCRAIKIKRILKKNNFIQKVKVKERVVLIIPNIFCFIRNYRETISFLKKLNYVLNSKIVKSIKIDYSDCDFLGLDASVLMDIIVVSCKRLRSSSSSLILEGNLPKTDEAKRVLIVSGLVKTLNINDASSKVLIGSERIDPFDTEMDANNMTNKVIDYYDRCLNKNNYQLTKKGIDKLNALVGENIDNLEIHSGENGVWFVAGHFDQMVQGRLGKGSLVLISLGNTFYESLTDIKSSETNKEKIRRVVKSRIEQGEATERIETIWSELALQYRISRFNDTTNPDRGTGTIKMIEGFSVLCKTTRNETPIMAVTTGKTQIIFDGKYKIERKDVNGSQVPIIAFNKENDLMLPPDEEYVKLLHEKFPGVIITIEFYVDTEYIERTNIKEGNGK